MKREIQPAIQQLRASPWILRASYRKNCPRSLVRRDGNREFEANHTVGVGVAAVGMVATRGYATRLDCGDQLSDDFEMITPGSPPYAPSSPETNVLHGDCPWGDGNRYPHPHPHRSGMYPFLTTYSHHPAPNDGGAPHYGGSSHLGGLFHPGGSPHHGPAGHESPHVPLHVYHSVPPRSHRGHHPRHHRGHGDGGHSSNPTTAYVNNATAPHSDATLFFYKAISESYPSAGIIAADIWSVNLLLFAQDPKNGATAVPNSTELPGSPYLQFRYFRPSRRTADGDKLGDIGLNQIVWARFDYTYKNELFILYMAGNMGLQFVIHQPKKAPETAETSQKLIQDLILHAGYWGQELRNEIWVYDMGYWRKDAALWDSMQQANWDDVILPPDLKNALRDDVLSYYKSKKTYDEIGIAWKRGLIMYGPPGNGKTMSLKALMKEIYYSLDISPIPTLYVRSLMGYGGSQGALLAIFEKARSVAPCMLVLEDLDSVVNSGNRSYFFNQLDGLDDNNGILVVGTTNHLDRLDPGIVARPSRFDRKYEFGLPGTGEGGRPTYVEYWRKKLEDRPGIYFPESLVSKIVDMTDGFSFAYMKEAFVSALLLIAARGGDGDDKDKEGLFERVIIQQLKILRKQLGNE